MRALGEVHRAIDEGFTLAELAVVTFILGILIVIALTSFVFAARSSAAITCESNQRILEDSIETYGLDHQGGLPVTLEELRPYVANFDTIDVCTTDESTNLEYVITDGVARIECPNHPRGGAMRYSRFERPALVLGTIAILATLLFSLDAGPTMTEIIAQLLMIPVLASAIHWGRRGGFVAAAAASLVYIILRIPMVTEAQGLNLDIATLLLSRLLAYGLVGIVGGELCVRIMYLFARMEDASSVDDWSGVFNQKTIGHSIAMSIGQHTRYDVPFSIILLEIDTRVLEGLRTAKQRQIVRHIAAHLRNDVRLVDEIGRLDDGRFVVLLPQTPSAGGEVVRTRLSTGVRETIGAKEESVRARLLAAPEQIEELEKLRDQWATAQRRPDCEAATTGQSST